MPKARDHEVFRREFPLLRTGQLPCSVYAAWTFRVTCNLVGLQVNRILVTLSSGRPFLNNQSPADRQWEVRTASWPYGRGFGERYTYAIIMLLPRTTLFKMHYISLGYDTFDLELRTHHWDCVARTAARPPW